MFDSLTLGYLHRASFQKLCLSKQIIFNDLKIYTSEKLSLKKKWSLLIISTDSNVNTYNVVLWKNVLFEKNNIKVWWFAPPCESPFCCWRGWGIEGRVGHLRSFHGKSFNQVPPAHWALGREGRRRRAETWVLVSVVKPLQSILRGSVGRRDHT